MLLLATALGLNLWLLTLGVPLWLGPHPAPLVLVLAPLSPLLLLFLHRPTLPGARAALLLGVPLLSFLPVADGPLADAALHPRPKVALQAAVLLAYLLCASRTLFAAGPTAGEVVVTALPEQPVPPRWQRRVFLYRFLVAFSVLAPLLLLYALCLHPGTLRALALSFGPPDRVSALQASAIAGLALLWAVVFHSFLAGPLRAHLSQDRPLTEELQSLRRLARRGRPRPQFYVAMLLALVSMSLLIHRSLRP